MSAEPSLTVVITCYKHASVIGDTIRSVWTQSLRPAEIIVIDDASPDASVSVVEALAPTSPVPIRLIKRRENSGGPARPSNEAVRAVRTEWVAMLDGDDPCADGRLEHQYRGLAMSAASPLCFGLTDTVGPDGVTMDRYTVARDEILRVPHRELAPGVYTLDRTRAYRQLLEERNFVASFSNMTFSKAAFDVVGGIDERYKVAGDLDFVCRCCGVGDLVFVDRVTCVHRLHGVNLGGSSFIRNRRDLLTVKATHAARPVFSELFANEPGALPDLLLAQAYWEARDGMGWKAVRLYFRAARAGAATPRALTGGLKALPSAAMARLGWRR